MTFSICMPAFNAEKWIGQAIASLQKQTDSDWELIAVDDASADRTWEILSDAARGDARIHVHRNETNLGQAGFQRQLIKSSISWQSSNSRLRVNLVK